MLLLMIDIRARKKKNAESFSSHEYDKKLQVSIRSGRQGLKGYWLIVKRALKKILATPFRLPSYFIFNCSYNLLLKKRFKDL